MKIALGSDHAGLDLKTAIKKRLADAGHKVDDFGTASPERTDYPDFAHEVARAVARGQDERGVLVCGTGIGMCIAANKVPGVRAALPYSEETAALSRQHNDSNVVCFGGRTMDWGLVMKMLDIWLDTPFEGGRHTRRVEDLEKTGE